MVPWERMWSMMAAVAVEVAERMLMETQQYDEWRRRTGELLEATTGCRADEIPQGVLRRLHDSGASPGEAVEVLIGEGVFE